MACAKGLGFQHFHKTLNHPKQLTRAVQSLLELAAVLHMKVCASCNVIQHRNIHNKVKEPSLYRSVFY